MTWRNYMVVFGQIGRLDPTFPEEPVDREEWDARTPGWRNQTMTRLTAICTDLKAQHRARNRERARERDIPTGSEEVAW